MTYQCKTFTGNQQANRWNDESLTRFLKTNTMTNLIEILKKETESLKVQYIQMNKDWAREQFKRIEGFQEEYRSINYTEKRERYYWLQKYLNREGYVILQRGVEAYVEKCGKDAEAHYEHSIEKLAFRIEKKGLDITNLKTLTSHVGVNIETTLTDGTKKVKAFTIIASGMVQRPHYRYLIK